MLPVLSAGNAAVHWHLCIMCLLLSGCQQRRSWPVHAASRRTAPLGWTSRAEPDPLPCYPHACTHTRRFMQQNRLSGQLPGAWGANGSWSQMRYLNLDNNPLGGTCAS